MSKALKRITALTIIVLLILAFAFSISHTAWGATQHMYDGAGYLSREELNYIDSYLTGLSEELQFDIVGVISYEGLYGDSQRKFADDFYDYGGFGYGSEKDGAIFVVDMNSRQMMLVTTGYGITAVTDYGEQLLYDYVTESLQREDFTDAFTTRYADTITDFVLMAREGVPVDVNNPGHDGYGWYQEPEQEYDDSAMKGEMMAGAGGLSAIIGIVAGFFSSQRQKSRLKTVKKKTQANSYARRDSLVLTRKQDRFLYSTVSVTPRPKHNDDNKRHGGGTTIHMGSSGVPHGGGHGRGF